MSLAIYSATILQWESKASILLEDKKFVQRLLHIRCIIKNCSERCKICRGLILSIKIGKTVSKRILYSLHFCMVYTYFWLLLYVTFIEVVPEFFSFKIDQFADPFRVFNCIWSFKCSSFTRAKRACSRHKT